MLVYRQTLWNAAVMGMVWRSLLCGGNDNQSVKRDVVGNNNLGVKRDMVGKICIAVELS